MGKVFVISGKQGVGKTTFVRSLTDRKTTGNIESGKRLARTIERCMDANPHLESLIIDGVIQSEFPEMKKAIDNIKAKTACTKNYLFVVQNDDEQLLRSTFPDEQIILVLRPLYNKQ